MKRYMVFCGQHYYPGGGIKDYIDCFSNKTQVMDHLNNEYAQPDNWAQVYDTRTGEVTNFIYDFEWHSNGSVMRVEPVIKTTPHHPLVGSIDKEQEIKRIKKEVWRQLKVRMPETIFIEWKYLWERWKKFPHQANVSFLLVENEPYVFEDICEAVSEFLFMDLRTRETLTNVICYPLDISLVDDQGWGINFTLPYKQLRKTNGL